MPFERSSRASVDFIVGRSPRIAASCSREFLEVEPPEFDPLDAFESLQLRQQRHERVATVQVVAAVGGDDHEALGPKVPDEEPEEVAGRAIGPVDIFEDERDRTDLRGSPERADDRIEEAGQSAGGIDGLARVADLDPTALSAQVRHEPRQAVGGWPEDGASVRRVEASEDRPERLDEWRVRKAAFSKVEAAAADGRSAGRLDARRDLGDEPALADAGLSGDQGERRSTGRRPVVRGQELLELGLSPDEDGAAATAGHAADHAISRAAGQDRSSRFRPDGGSATRGPR